MIIRGVDLLGQPFEERATAQDLSFHGCRYASKHHLPKNTWITLEVPSSGSRNEAVCVRARVAWIQRPRTLRDLFQVGAELERGRNIWGLAPVPSDWVSSAAMTTVRTQTERSAPSEQSSAEYGKEGTSLEAYLQMAFAHTNRDFALGAESGEANLHGDNLALEHLREEFIAAANKITEKRRAAGDEPAQETSEEMRDVENEETATTEAFQRKWTEALEQATVAAREDIASTLTKNVAAQLANFEARMRDVLIGEWTEKPRQPNLERSEWEAELQALRNEIRANTRASEERGEEKLAERLKEIRREWECSGIIARQEDTAVAETGGGISAFIRKQMVSETDTARAQWGELLESSLDSAARRLNERLSSCSQEMVQRTEHEVAVRIAELQKETGLAAEAGRAALNELRSALDENLSNAKTELDGIEQSAGRFSEYSRQLEAASQDSVNELRQRLESSMGRQCAELEKHAMEIEKRFAERATQMLEQMGRESVAQGVEQIGRAVAAGLARAAKAADDLASREEQAEDILRIHRERLRQVSEQSQRDVAVNLTSQAETAQRALEEMRAESLTQWKAELAQERLRAAEEASSALASESERRLLEADTQLLSQAQRAVDSVQLKFEEALHPVEAKFAVELGEIETSHIASARERLALEALERLESARDELARAAKMAGTAFNDAIEEGAEKALQSFSAAGEAKAEEGCARLIATGENVLAGIQSHAQSSFEHFQEQLGIKADQALQRASETLAHQFEAAMERFRTQGESQLKDWSAEQEAMSALTLEKHKAQLEDATNSWVEMTLERLDSRSEERVDSAVRATENAIREACVDIFENIAQMMKKQLQGTLEIRPAASASEMNPHDHRASA